MSFQLPTRMAEAALRMGDVDLAFEDLEQVLSVPSRAHRSIIRQDPLWLTFIPSELDSSGAV